MVDTTALMMRLIKSEITECSLDNSIEITEEELGSLYAFAKSHDITQLLLSPLEKLSALKSEYTISDKFRKALFTAVSRYKKSEYDLKSICQLFEDEGIDYIILKGGVLRNYYPKPYLRTSCDIDILIRPDDVDFATELLVNKLQFKLHAKEQYDISLFSPSKGHFELHFKLIERGFKEMKTLCDIWHSSEIAKNSSHGFVMSPELFLLYHIYHMAKHFIQGGCGIKPFVDLWIIKNRMGYDEDKAITLLKENDLYEFYRGASDLTDVWFEDKEHSDITHEIEDYILAGGVYGTLEQNLAMPQNRKGGRFNHLLSRIFLSYNAMLVYYPSLKKCPVLYPLYQVRRWFRILFCGGSKRAFTEIRLNQNLSNLKKEKAKLLLTELGL